MLTALRAADLRKVEARACKRGVAEYLCPACRSDLILKQGMVKVAHFAHRPDADCEYGSGESAKHREAKIGIFDALCGYSLTKNCELEKEFGPIRADVYYEQGAFKFAVEVQVSTLSMDRIIQRTQAYSRLGIHVLWLGFYEQKLCAVPYTPRQWEKWAHAAYFGRVYYWIGEDLIGPAHFSPYQLYVEQTDWGGGYYRNSKRYRVVKWGKTFRIGKPRLAPIKREGWGGGSIYIPPCRLAMDEQPRWWRKSEDPNEQF